MRLESGEKEEKKPPETWFSHWQIEMLKNTQLRTVVGRIFPQNMLCPTCNRNQHKGQQLRTFDFEVSSSCCGRFWMFSKLPEKRGGQKEDARAYLNKSIKIPDTGYFYNTNNNNIVRYFFLSKLFLLWLWVLGFLKHVSHVQMLFPHHRIVLDLIIMCKIRPLSTKQQSKHVQLLLTCDPNFRNESHCYFLSL